MLGPGTTITHAAIRALAENGCLVMWCGEGAVRFYAQGLGETRRSRNLLRQASLVSDPALRMGVVRKLYQMRFAERLDESLSLREIRGKEGIRVRQAYAKASRESGVEWKGRVYKRDGWGAADPVNRALSAANSCLYGVCQAGIISSGYSPALGFIHTGRMLSFVYDVADLYKTEVTVPAAFRATVEGRVDLESRVRHHCRDLFGETRLLFRIQADLEAIMATDGLDLPGDADPDSDPAAPGGLWDPEAGEVAGGQSYGHEPDGGDPGGADGSGEGTDTTSG